MGIKGLMFIKRKMFKACKKAGNTDATENKVLCNPVSRIIRVFCGIFMLAALLLPLSAHSGSLLDSLAIGVGYPYLSIKYGLTDKYHLEARYAFSEDIKIYGGRVYSLFGQIDDVSLLAGLEVDYTKFEDDEISGSGTIVYPFVGGEYFVLDKFSVIMDLGPAFISLREDEYDLTVDGFEWVVNLGIYWYPR